MSRRYWYLYDGTHSDQLPGSYVAPTPTQSSCAGGGFTCSIYVPAGGLNPTPAALTPNIKAYLAVAKSFGYSAYPFGSTPYVESRP